MDEADITGDRMEAEEEFQRRKREAKNSIALKLGPEVCEGCEASMPMQRRLWGCTLCTECKTAAEKKRKFFAESRL